MERLSIQPTPSGNAVDSDTLHVLSLSEDFVRRDDGTFRFIDTSMDEWVLVEEATHRSPRRPTVQRLNLDSGGVIFWYSAIHTGKALFEYKHNMSAVPSRHYMYAAVL